MSNENKNTEQEAKLKAEAKVKEDARAEAEAVAEAEAAAELEAQADAEKEAKAEAKKVGKPRRRVWRQIKPRVMRNTIIKTLMEHGRMVGEVKVPGRNAELTPNNANQYVLGAGAIEYGKQLGVLLGRVASGDLIEVDPSTEGVPFVSKEEKDLAEFESKARALRKKLGVPEPEIVI